MPITFNEFKWILIAVVILVIYIVSIFYTGRTK